MSNSKMKSLAKDTAIYGLSSIIGRLLNWGLVPLYSYIFLDPIEFGKIQHVYGYIALLMVLLTYGMETGFFRFMNKKEENTDSVLSTSIISLGVTSLLFIAFCFAFITPIGSWLKYDNSGHLLIMAVVVAIDAFMTIPYAKLRQDKRPVRFMIVRFAFIFSNILLNLFFLLLCPWIYKDNPSLIDWFYNPSYGIGYVFVANLLSSLLVLLMLSPTLRGLKLNFNKQLLRRILKYSFPLLILGLAGVLGNVITSLAYPYLFETMAEANYQMGVYNACIKITMIITLFTQAFRYAYEPFVFAENKGSEDRNAYAQAMKYFIIVALLGFITTMFYLDIVMHLLSENYRVAVAVIPIAMLGEIFYGIYFNLSIWYKLTDKTRYGAILSVLGCITIILINVVFVPSYGFIASAWAVFISSLMIMSISYLLGQKHFPIKYPLKDILFYFILALLVYLVGMYVNIENDYLRYAHRTALLLIFLFIFVRKDLLLKEIPIINKYIKKR